VISIEIKFPLDRARRAMKSSQVLRGLFKDPGRQILLICLRDVTVGSVHIVVVFGCHSFLKHPKIDISENFRFFARLAPSGRIETEQQNDQDEDEWHHAHGRKIARARVASRIPRRGLRTANQKETFQPES
jgi:hypothetical protein